MVQKKSPLINAIESESYEYLLQHAPDFLDAIQSELDNGKTVDEIRYLLTVELGSDRIALVRRCVQAANWIVNNK